VNREYRESLGIPHRTGQRSGATEARLVLPDRLDRPTLGTLSSAQGDFKVIEPLFEAWVDDEQRLAVLGSDVRLQAVHRFFRRASARIDLNPLVSWSLRVEGNLVGIRADLAQVPVRSLEVMGSVTDGRIALGCAEGLVRVRIGGSVRGLVLASPEGIPARVVIGRERVSDPPDFDAASSRLLVEIEGDANDLFVTTRSRSAGTP
jgi:hypothetical protein